MKSQPETDADAKAKLTLAAMAHIASEVAASLHNEESLKPGANVIKRAKLAHGASIDAAVEIAGALRAAIDRFDETRKAAQLLAGNGAGLPRSDAYLDAAASADVAGDAVCSLCEAFMSANRAMSAACATPIYVEAAFAA